MFFSFFNVIPPSVTTWNLSEKKLYKKMTYLVEFWLILESDLVELSLTKYFLNWYETITKNTNAYILTNTFGLTEFGSVMKKLWRFYPKHLILTSFRTGHKPYFPQSVTPKIQRPTSWFLNHRYLDMFSHFHRNLMI